MKRSCGVRTGASGGSSCKLYPVKTVEAQWTSPLTSSPLRFLRKVVRGKAGRVPPSPAPLNTQARACTRTIKVLRWCDRAFTRNCAAHELSTSWARAWLPSYCHSFWLHFWVFSKQIHAHNTVLIWIIFSIKKESGSFWPSGEQADFKMWFTLPTSPARSCENFELQDGNTYR